MKTQLEDISPVKKSLKVDVLPDVVLETRHQAVKEFQQKATLPGFRQGKAPAKLIEEKFLAEIQKQTIEKIVDQTLIPALQETGVRPVSPPEIEPGLWQAGGGFSYKAIFEVLPEVPLKEKDYKGLKLEKEEVEVSKEEIDQELKRLQEALTQLEPLSNDTAASDGHVVIIDYKGRADGKDFKGGEAKDFPVEIGAGALLKDFEEGLKGAKGRENRSLELTYPQDYFNKDLAGKKGEFKITVKSVRKKIVPEFNDDFAKDLGNFKNIGEVKEDVKKRIVQLKENDQKNHLFNQIIRQLSDTVSFEVPESLVHNELRHMLNDLAKDMKAQGQDLQKLDLKEVVKHLEPNAKTRVKSFLALNKLTELLKVDVTDAELDQRFEGIAKASQATLPEVKAYYEKNKLTNSLKTRILHEKALEIVLKESKIKAVKPKNDKK